MNNNFLDQHSHEGSTLNGSINTSIRQNHNTSQEAQQTAPQSYLIPPADIITGPKSYYSSINNILPCVDAEHSVTRSIENSMEKPSIKNNNTNTKSGSKPDEIAKGLTALHSKVDELLKKMPIVRESGDKSHRAASPARITHTNPAQVFTLNAIQESGESSANKASIVVENPSFKLISQPHLSSLTTYESQGVFESKVLKSPASPVRELLSKENTARSSPQAENKTMKPLEFNVEAARDYSDTKYIYRQEQLSPVRAYQQSPQLSTPRTYQQSPTRTYEHSPVRAYEQSPVRVVQTLPTEPSETRKEEIKPKYDEKKLEAIIARIRQKNSVSPAPRQRSSVTPGDAYTPIGAGTAKTSWSTTKKNVDLFNDRNGIKTEPNYQLTNQSHEESSIVDIPNEKDPHATGHTTIMDLLDKKRTPKNSKFRDDQPEEEYGERTPPRTNKMVPGERKMRIFTSQTDSATKTADGIPRATVYLQDIIKGIQEDKPLKITDILKDKSASEKKVTEKQNFELKEKTLNEKNPYIGQKEDEGIKTRGRELFNQSPEVKKSSKYFTEEEEDAPDHVLKQALYEAGFSATAKTRQKSVDAYRGRVNNHFQLRLEDARPTYKPSTESGRILDSERKPQDLYKVNLQALKGPGKEEDSLLPDDSVFSMREGGPMSQKQINTTGPHGGSVPKENMALKNELDTTVVRNRFLQDDMDISDFDFDKNRLDTQEFYANPKEAHEITQRLEDNYNLGVKRQKTDDKTPSFGLHERVLPKTEVPRNGVLGRAI